MLNKKSKKGASAIVWLVASMAAILLFFLLYSNAWTNLFGKGTSSINEQLGSTGDYDKDNVMNIADKCPCKLGDVENDGCPKNYKITGSGNGNEDRSCLKT